MADAGGVFYTVDASTADSLKQLQILAKQNSETGRSFTDLDKKVNDFNKSISMMGGRVTSAGTVLNAFGQTNTKATEQLRKLNAEVKAASINAQLMEGRQNVLNAKMNQATKGIRMSSNAMGQLGYQIQDIAAMMSVGASPFSIIATQGGQIASIFGPGGAVAGAFIGMAAILGGVLFNSISDASGELEEFQDTVKDLTEKELSKLEGALKAVAIQMFSDEAKELTAQQSDLQVVIDRQSTSLNFLNSQYAALASSGKENTEEAKDLKRAIDIGNKSLIERQAALQLVNKELDSMLRKSGIVKGEITDLAGANNKMTDSQREFISQQKSAESQVESLTKQVELASTAIVGTAEDVSILSEKQKLGWMVAGAYSKEIEELTKRLLILKDQLKAKKQIEDMSKSLKVSRNELISTSREQFIYTEMLKLGKHATEEQRKEVEKLANSLMDAQQQLKAKDQIKELSDAVIDSKFAISGLNEQQFIYNQLMEIGEGATDEQKKKIGELSKELFRLQVIQNGLGGPTQLGMTFTGDMQSLQQQLDLELITHEEFLAQKLELEQNYDDQLRAIQEERYRRESEANAFVLDTINAMGDTAANVFSGMIQGTMTFSDGVKAMANTILNEAIGAVVQLGVEYVKNQIIGQTAAAATAATSAATGAAMAAAYAPAAAMASLASFGANAAPAQAGIATTVATTQALSIPGREVGGTVSAGNMFRVGEGNKPEVFVPDGLTMIPGQNGRVFNQSQLEQMNGGTGGGFNVTINNEPGVVSAVVSQDEKNIIIKSAVNMARGEFSKSMSSKNGPYYNAAKQNWGEGTTNGRPT